MRVRVQVSGRFYWKQRDKDDAQVVRADIHPARVLLRGLRARELLQRENWRRKGASIYKPGIMKKRGREAGREKGALILVCAATRARLLTPRWKRCWGKPLASHVLTGQKRVPPPCSHVIRTSAWDRSEARGKGRKSTHRSAAKAPRDLVLSRKHDLDRQAYRLARWRLGVLARDVVVLARAEVLRWREARARAEHLREPRGSVAPDGGALPMRRGGRRGQREIAHEARGRGSSTYRRLDLPPAAGRKVERQHRLCEARESATFALFVTEVVPALRRVDKLDVFGRREVVVGRGLDEQLGGAEG